MGGEEKEPGAESSVLESSQGATPAKGEDIDQDMKDGKIYEITVERTTGEEEKGPAAESCVKELHGGSTSEKGEVVSQDEEAEKDRESLETKDNGDGKLEGKEEIEPKEAESKTKIVIEEGQEKEKNGNKEENNQVDAMEEDVQTKAEEEGKEPLAESCVAGSNGSSTPKKCEDIAQDKEPEKSGGKHDAITEEPKREEEKKELVAKYHVAESNGGSIPEKDEDIALDEEAGKDGGKTDEISMNFKIDIHVENLDTKVIGEEKLNGNEKDGEEQMKTEGEDKKKEIESKEEEEVEKNGSDDKGNEVDAMEEDVLTKVKEEEESKENDDKNIDTSIEADDEKESKEEEEEEQQGEDIKKKKGSKSRGKAKSSPKEGKDDNKKTIKKMKEPITPLPSINERPVRERKSVERLVASIEKDSNKEILIEKGRGTALKDIPNVAYKLSNKKSDDILKLLHTILFGRRGKAIQFKSNIFRFSGYVWKENEEKQKLKVKEKLDKCVKEKLLELCDVLDIPVNKATIKEDIVVKLIDFLIAPQSTTTELLAEKEDQSAKGKKRKRAAKESASADIIPSKHSAKSLKKTENEEDDGLDEEKDEEDEEEEEEEEEEENVNGVTEKVNDKVSEHSESEEEEEEESADETEDESEQDTRKRKRGSKKSSAKKRFVVKPKKKVSLTTPKKSTRPAKKAKVELWSKADDDSDASLKKTVSGRKNVEVVYGKPSNLKKKAASSTEKPGKKIAKGRSKTKEEKPPSDKNLKDAICEILKEVDFHTATFTDIVNQLGMRFKTDLTARKPKIKIMIQDELTKLAEAEDEDEDDDDDDDENDGNQPSGRGVKA